MKKTILVLIVSIVFFLFLGINLDINIYDEGVAIVGAENILYGKLPNLDFWTIYSPGWFLLLSLWIALFGKQIILIRILTTTINVLNVLIFYRIIKKETKQEFISISLTVILIGLLSLNTFYARNVPFALTLILLGFYLLLNTCKNKYFWLALLIGLLFVIRHDFAFYYCLILLSFWIFQLILDKTNLQFKEIVIFCVTLFVFFTLFVSISFAFNILNGFIQDAIAFPLFHFREARSLPFPNPFEIIFNTNYSSLTKANKLWEASVFYFPFVLVAISFLFILLKKISIKNLGKFFILSILGTIILSFQAITRSDVEHIIPAFVFSLFVFGKFIEVFFIQKKVFLAIIMLFFVIPPSVKKIVNVSKLVHPEKTVELASPYAKLIKIPTEFSYYNELLSYILDNCKKGKIYSGVTQHHKIYINDVIIYYLTGKSPPTKYYELHPGVATSKKIQEIIIEDLKNEKVEYIVLYQTDKFEKQNYKGSKILDQFINENYEPQKVFGKYLLLKNKVAQQKSELIDVGEK